MNLNLDRSTWDRVRFGDVVRNVNEYFDADRDGELPFVAGPHIEPGELKPTFGSTEDVDFPPTFKRMFIEGDVLLHSRGIQKLAVADRRGVTGEKLFVLRSKDARLAQRFLPFLMLSPAAQRYMADNFTGSVNKFLNWKPLAEFEFDLPPLNEQQCIADLLWAVENHRRDAVALVDLATSAADTAFDVALAAGHANGWPIAPVTELVTAGPSNGKSATANDEQRGLPTLSISAVRDGRIVGGAAVKYVEIDRSAIENFLLMDGDFLVVRGNGNKQLTALGGMVRGGLPDDCFYPDLLIRLRFDETVIRRDFAARQWNAPRAHGALLRSAKSTNGIWKINGKDIKSHQLVVPPLDAQDALLERIEAMDSARASAHVALSEITNLKTAFISEVFE